MCIRDREYQEIKSVTTNILGLFTVVVGSQEIGKIITSNYFETINWSSSDKYLKVEADLTGDFSFIPLGQQKINYVPFAFYADKVDAKNVIGILSIVQGGTGLSSIKDIKTNWQLDKVNNTLDSEKPASESVLALLEEKLNKIDTNQLSNRINQKLGILDTLYLSNRINLKLNKLDTITISNRINQKLNSYDTLSLSNRINQIPKTETSSLSNRINQKLNSYDTSSLSNRINLKQNKFDTIYLSNRINQKLNSSDTNYLSTRINNKISIGSLSSSDIIQALNFTPVRDDYGHFYDTSKQQTAVSTALSIKFNFTNFSNNINVTNNTSGLPSRITVINPGIYNVKYTLQFIKSDVGTDEVSIWVRRNSIAYANTHNSYVIQGSNIKNVVSASFWVDLGLNDYIEIYFSVKNTNSCITGSAAMLLPSRPATPSAMVSLQRIN